MKTLPRNRIVVGVVVFIVSVVSLYFVFLGGGDITFNSISISSEVPITTGVLRTEPPTNENNIRYFTGSQFVNLSLLDGIITPLGSVFSLPNVSDIKWSEDSVAINTAGHSNKDDLWNLITTGSNPYLPRWWVYTFNDDAYVEVVTSSSGALLVDFAWGESKGDYYTIERFRDGVNSAGIPSYTYGFYVTKPDSKPKKLFSIDPGEHEIISVDTDLTIIKTGSLLAVYNTADGKLVTLLANLSDKRKTAYYDKTSGTLVYIGALLENGNVKVGDGEEDEVVQNNIVEYQLGTSEEITLLSDVTGLLSYTPFNGSFLLTTKEAVYDITLQNKYVFDSTIAAGLQRTFSLGDGLLLSGSSSARAVVLLLAESSTAIGTQSLSAEKLPANNYSFFGDTFVVDYSSTAGVFTINTTGSGADVIDAFTYLESIGINPLASYVKVNTSLK